MDSLYSEIGGRMRSCRTALRKTQSQIAEAAGIDASFYGQIERGKNVPSVRTVLAIAHALGVEPGTLLPGPRAGKTDYSALLSRLVGELPSRKRKFFLELVGDVADRLKDR